MPMAKGKQPRATTVPVVWAEPGRAPTSFMRSAPFVEPAGPFLPVIRYYTDKLGKKRATITV